MRTRRSDRTVLRVAAFGASAAVLALAAPPAVAAPECGPGRATEARIGAPAAGAAWRARLFTKTRFYRSVPKQRGRHRGWIGPDAAPALLVLRTKRDRDERCWLRVRLPSRPNTAAGWVRADRVVPQRTSWRIGVSSDARRVAVFRDGKRLRRFRVVVGAPGTPTPTGLFSIVGVWRWNPADFLGSYILPLTAHSNVLQEFGGGDGRVGIHGRGGASLLAPLGSAASHGCIRLSNRMIEWLVRRVGARALPGIPVRVR